MIIYSDIKETLLCLNKKFNHVNSRSTRIANLELCLYSKIVLLEYSGWLEQSFDKILQEYIDKQTPTSAYRILANKEMIKPIYGFQFERDFCPLFLGVLGVKNYEQLMTPFEATGEADVLRSRLNALIVYRNTLAHSCFHKNASLTSVLHSATLPTPSSIYQDFFITLLPIMKKISTKVIKMKP